jgi:trehalose 6-phosphate synthase
MPTSASNSDREEEGGRLFVVANRLPISIKAREDGGYDFSASAGGLASSLAGLATKVDFVWFGWPGIDVHRNDRDQLRRDLGEKHSAVPVFLNSDLAEKHYNGFSNSVLWPLLHRLPEKADSKGDWPEAYREVNEIFADNLLPHLEDGDKVWIHDYHLLLLPSALRCRLRSKSIKIGFFLHTPFPSEDYFSILPFREAICEGLFNCDVVGFHTRDYVDDFLDSAEKVLPEVRRSPSDLHYRDRKIIVHHFPIGIDPERFKSSLATPAVRHELASMSRTYAGKTVILGVDRLDYTKGIPQKLFAFEKMLADNPQYLGKVVLIQLAVPTRPGVTEYAKLQKQVESLVGRVNGRHSSPSYTPVIYMHRSIPFDQLCALYALADICIVSPIRDGLNLVSYEYVICQAQKAATAQSRSRSWPQSNSQPQTQNSEPLPIPSPSDSSNTTDPSSKQTNTPQTDLPPTAHHADPGILLLSQYTGAATTLRDALIFNPWDTPRFADTIKRALNMDSDERQRRHDNCVKVVQQQTSVRWGEKFLAALERMRVDDDMPNDRVRREGGKGGTEEKAEARDGGDGQQDGDENENEEGPRYQGADDAGMLRKTESRGLEAVASAEAKS